MGFERTLENWYATRSAVRRLWAIEEREALQIVILLEPTGDGDDIYPVWMANSDTWINELQDRCDKPVKLSLSRTPSLDATDIDGVLIADLCWRDPCAPMN